MKIESYIPTGRKNAINRAELCRITGKDDRANREAIREARNRGVPIVASPKGGYYITESTAEIARLRNEMLSRARDMQRTAKRLDQLAAEMSREELGV